MADPQVIEADWTWTGEAFEVTVGAQGGNEVTPGLR